MFAVNLLLLLLLLYIHVCMPTVNVESIRPFFFFITLHRQIKKEKKKRKDIPVLQLDFYFHEPFPEERKKGGFISGFSATLGLNLFTVWGLI